ncbi:hypothetical protein EDB19DRAFT_1685854 [Suillus lakei]|nr:hypothetical protein EDB19DRAFT_1685854 [Suillus lakei]
MHFSSVLAIVAALTVSISAMPSFTEASISAREADTEKSCPTFCLKNSNCNGCGSCVSMSSLRPGFNHMTHRRGRSPFFAPSVAAVSRVSVFSTSVVWLMT